MSKLRSASFGWKGVSLFDSKSRDTSDCFVEGMRWQVGSSTLISFWDDP